MSSDTPDPARSARESEIETEMTSDPVCPSCGHVEHDWNDWNFGGGLEGETEHDCNSCGEPFHIEREVSVYFTSRKLP